MTQNHHYPVQILWTGNRGQGTSHYRDYDRSHEILIEGKPTILGSSDPTFRGNAHRHNPEEMLVASLSACHMLWYLHLCATSSVVVTHYLDRAIGTMVETPEGGGHFSKVVLQPVVTITATSDPIKAEALHSQAHHLCFIANSVNFPVDCEPSIQVDDSA